MVSKLKLFIYDFLLVLGVILIIIGSYLFFHEIDQNETEETNYEISYSRPSSLELDYSVPEAVDRQVELDISYGTSVLEVANLLDEQGITNSEDFLWLINEFDLETRIKAGSYQFYQNESLRSIFDELSLPQRGGENDD